MKTNHIYLGDSKEVLKTFPDESVNCAVTSPPYWSLRDYGVEGQMGLEKSFDEYVGKMCNVFDEVKRVLRKDGTCWVNLGDTYCGSGGASCNESSIEKRKVLAGAFPKQKDKPKWNKINYQKKSLGMIPFRFAIEMVNRGWILRNVIIWHKPNAMPASVKDRFTVDFEYLFFFTKSKKYFFETQYEKSKTNSYKKFNIRVKRIKSERIPYFNYRATQEELDCVPEEIISGKRNKRCVWSINTKGFHGEHFATYPSALIETPIKAGCPENGIVLDPFMGSGTTALVALEQKKRYVGIELNLKYKEIAEQRIKSS